MKIDDILELLNEELPLLKFHYKNWRNDKNPRVVAFDRKYPGRIGEKRYGEREDILGWNLNYYKNSEEARKNIDDINDFSTLLSKNKLEKYKRIAYFFPEVTALLRRYKKDKIVGMKKMSDDGLWKKEF
jgi:hypothetical protein